MAMLRIKLEKVKMTITKRWSLSGAARIVVVVVVVGEMRDAGDDDDMEEITYRLECSRKWKDEQWEGSNRDEVRSM